MSKQDKLLSHLKAGHTITGREAWISFGLYRLSSSIYNLRNKGHEIECEIIRRGDDVYGRYYMRAG